MDTPISATTATPPTAFIDKLTPTASSSQYLPEDYPQPAAPRAPSPYMRLFQEIAIRARNARAMGKEYAAAVVEAERLDARYAARKRVYLRELEYEKA